MILKSKYSFPVVASALLSVLIATPGCFTGIERTPAIKDTTKGSSKVKPTAEQLLMEQIVAEAPGEWRKNKPFLVSEGRLDYAFSPVSASMKLKPGDTLRFSTFRPAVRLSGDSVTEVVMTTPTSEELIYRLELPKQQIINEQALSIPFTVDLDLVDQAKTVLKGIRVWTLKPNSRGIRYQAAEITDVLPGNSDYPFRVVAGSDTLFMVANSLSNTSRTFANLFTVNNPRKLHPEISNTNWNLISRGKVALDMTREECRLAIGAPSQIERNALPGGIYERWTYEDGVYLIFTDGLLTNFRQ